MYALNVAKHVRRSWALAILQGFCSSLQFHQAPSPLPSIVDGLIIMIDKFCKEHKTFGRGPFCHLTLQQLLIPLCAVIFTCFKPNALIACDYFKLLP